MKIKDKNKLFSEIIREYEKKFGEKLISICLYGSVVTEDFNPKTSDINLAIILEDSKLDTLISAKNVIKKFQKKRVTVPLFLTKEYIENSLDTFPIEFLNIKVNHKKIYGEDCFENLKINSEHLRLQAERELKGKLLLLRLAFLENVGNIKFMQNLVSTSLLSFIPVMKAILVIKNESVPSQNIDIIRKIAELLQIDFSVFLQALDIKNKKIKMKKQQFVDFFERYIQTIDKLSEIVDKLESIITQ